MIAQALAAGRSLPDGEPAAELSRLLGARPQQLIFAVSQDGPDRHSRPPSHWESSIETRRARIYTHRLCHRILALRGAVGRRAPSGRASRSPGSRAVRGSSAAARGCVWFVIDRPAQCSSTSTRHGDRGRSDQRGDVRPTRMPPRSGRRWCSTHRPMYPKQTPSGSACSSATSTPTGTVLSP